MLNRVLVIHNPVAGRRTKKRLDQFLTLLHQSEFEVRVWETTASGDARVQAANSSDIDIIIAAGGDGTVNEVLNGVYERETDQPLPALGFLPLGTANVLALELGLPSDPQQLFELLQAGRTYDIRPGIANGRRFLLMASVGVDARAVAAVTPPLKRKFGAFAYIIGAIQSMGSGAPTFHVTINGEELTAKTIILTRSQKYGGPFTLAEDAGLKTQIMQAVLFRSSGYIAAIRYGIGLALGRLKHHKDIVFLNVDEVEVTCEVPDPVQIDGDVASQLPLKVSIDVQPIRFLAP
ncbi:MAG: diacylglycerol kinase family lipid kinase [Proteobacteria bacterium]|nr:diacylglycerol kinase family lipid kinase [Pseudomonadota bacterium]